jgi:hypothetical protein
MGFVAASAAVGDFDAVWAAAECRGPQLNSFNCVRACLVDGDVLMMRSTTREQN